MPEGSTVRRGITELGSVLETYHNTVPESVYIYADGGGDRRVTFHQVQMGLIALFLYHDLDEIICAQLAAGQSFRNPIERCHSVANLRLQGVGLMRQDLKPDSENIRKAFLYHEVNLESS